MDPETIRKIALEGVHLLPSYGWTWTQLVLQVLLTMLAAGVGAYASSYLKIRAQNLAIKADFNSLQKRLSAQTELGRDNQNGGRSERLGSAGVD